MSNLTPVIKSIQDVMGQDAGINGDAQRIEPMVWLLFLKVLCAAIKLTEPSAAHRGYIKLFFENEKSYDEIRQLSAGGAQPNLNLAKVKATLVPLPPLAEQARIVDRVTELRRLCTDLRQRLTAAKTTQSRLAEALVEGAMA